MKILSRHLLKNLLQPLIYLLVAFTLLFVIGDLMDNASEFLEAGTLPRELLYYYALRLPSMVIMIVPLCLLLAVLYSLSTLTRHSEIIAMRASGISIYRIIRPYIFIGTLCLVVTAVINEYTGPKFAYRADQFVDHQKLDNDDVYREAIAFKDPESRHLWQIEQFDTRTYTMKNLKLMELREDNTALIQYSAEKAQWLDGDWWFEKVYLQKFDELGNRQTNEFFQILEMRSLTELPEDFMNEIKDPTYQSSMELWNYIQTHQALLSPETLTKYEVDFHHKLTMPFVCIVITLIGIPVGAHTGRKGAFAGIMLALALFFGFYATQFTMEYFAKQMYIIPWVGAWGAIIAFFAIGSVMIHRMR